jgi:hypothetical protein
VEQFHGLKAAIEVRSYGDTTTSMGLLVSLCSSDVEARLVKVSVAGEA